MSETPLHSGIWQVITEHENRFNMHDFLLRLIMQNISQGKEFHYCNSWVHYASLLPRLNYTERKCSEVFFSK
jgi:hypothetical protein